MCDTSMIRGIGGRSIVREDAAATVPFGGGNGGEVTTQPTAPASAMRAASPLL